MQIPFAGSSPFIPPSTPAKKGGEEVSGLTAIRTQLLLLKLVIGVPRLHSTTTTLPRRKPIKARQQTFGLPTTLLGSTEVGLNDTW